MGNSRQLPFGYRFLPTDLELIREFLIKKLKNQHLPCNAVVEGDVYGTEPCNLKVNNGIGGAIDKGYYFVYRAKKSSKATRPNRDVNPGHGSRGGFWKATGGDKEIRDERNNLVGVKKSLKFYRYTTDMRITKESDKTDWIMHEYTLPPSKKEFQPWVLCSIRFNGDAADPEKGGKLQQQEAVPDHHHNDHVEPILEQEHQEVLHDHEQGQQPLMPWPSTNQNTIFKEQNFRFKDYGAEGEGGGLLQACVGSAYTSMEEASSVGMYSGACSSTNHHQAVPVAAAQHLINDNNNNNAHDHRDDQLWSDEEMEKLLMLPDDYDNYGYSYCYPAGTAALSNGDHQWDVPSTSGSALNK